VRLHKNGLSFLLCGAAIFLFPLSTNAQSRESVPVGLKSMPENTEKLGSFISGIKTDVTYQVAPKFSLSAQTPAFTKTGFWQMPERQDSAADPGVSAGVSDSGGSISDAASVLPDAPGYTSTRPATSGSVQQEPPGYVTLPYCPYDKTHAKECRMHWHQMFISSALYLAFQNAGNLYTGYWYRYETMTGKWWDRYIASVDGWLWDRWADNNSFVDDYVGHPMMGAITNNIWRQNDPKAMSIEQGNNWLYYRGLLRATAYSTIFSFEWKLGPIGEASIGHNGDHYYHDQNTVTNETGWVDLVTTPVGGTLWTMAEDAVDRHLVRRIENKPRNPFMLLGLSFLTPAEGTANILRFRPPWYRDSRTVKAASFWSDPPPPYDRESIEIADAEASGRLQATRLNRAEEGLTEMPSPEAVNPVMRPGPPEIPQWPYYGGVHEFGAWWGLSLISGHIWGSAGDIKYMPIDLRYSYLLTMKDHWAFRYSPELTALAMLDEPVPNPTNNPMLNRKRTYGSGLSPVGFQSDFFPSHRVQPFLSTNGGFIYFMDKVLSPEGSQFMYTVDFGAGINIFRKQRQAVTIGYRYQHLSNADISHHNPGTDANIFYVSVSRFRTKGYR